MSNDTATETADHDTASNVLCACPAVGSSRATHCQRLLTRAGQPESIVGVTIATSPAERLAAWRDAIDPATTEISFVNVTHGGRSATMSTNGSGGGEEVPTDIVEIGEMDLRRLGTEITAQLREASGAPTALCFDSLTDVLQFESKERIHRFLNVVTARVTEAGAYAHYHIDSNGHANPTFETLAPVFDETVSDGIEFE
ncbi:MAG: DUF7504 family protein [Halapricum sp.]